MFFAVELWFSIVFLKKISIAEPTSKWWDNSLISYRSEIFVNFSIKVNFFISWRYIYSSSSLPALLCCLEIHLYSVAANFICFLKMFFLFSIPELVNICLKKFANNIWLYYVCFIQSLVHFLMSLLAFHFLWPIFIVP